ncbi:MAG: hypothetical protein GF329_22430 [Candidatus Lokiarchaeota archaeon]|nr:hypothetical protein [Candidatus Lokiarchaeota archaeon]
MDDFGAEEFMCKLFEIESRLIDKNNKIFKSVGEIEVLVPTKLLYLSDYVITGQKLLNQINFCLDEQKLRYFYPIKNILLKQQ